jgi:hypothetical protein
MRHFLGGWAAGTIIVGLELFRRGSNGTKAIDCILWAAICAGPLFGIAVWGLWL